MASKYSLETVFKVVDRLSGPIKTMGAGVKRFANNAEASLKKLDQTADKMFSGLKKGAVALGAAGAAGALVAKNIIDAGSSFEQAITNVGAVSLMTRDQIKDLEVEALRLGATTKFSATEAANAMELMAKAGFTNKDILAGVGGVLAAAAAEGGDLAETAGHVSNVLKGMGLAASDATKVADVLALASARTNSSISSLGESMKNLAPVARQFKIPMHEAIGAVALLQDVGMDASEAGTATATMLTKLTQPLDAVKQKMRRLGVTFQDAKGDMLPLTQVLANFDKAANKGGNMEVVSFFADLVGLRGQKAALNLQAMFKTIDETTGKSKFVSIVDALDKATGSAEKMAAIKMDTFQGDMLVLEAAVDAVKVALFDLQGAPLRGVVQGMSKWVSENQALIVGGVKEFIEDFKAALPDIVKWGERIAKMAAVFYGVAAAVKVATVAFAALTFVMEANPLTLWIMGITAAVALIWGFWPEISEFFANLWDGTKWLAGVVADGFMSMVDGIVSAFRAVFEPVKSVITAIVEFYVGVWSRIGSAIYTVLEPAFSWVAARVVEVVDWVIEKWQPIGEFFSELWDGVVEVATFAGERIVAGFVVAVDAVQAAWSAVVGFFSGIWEGIKTAFFAVLDPVWEKITWAVDMLGKVGEFIGGEAAGVVMETRAQGRDVMSGERQLISPSERVARSITESRSVSETELTIKDETKRAQVTKRGRGAILPKVQPSGAFP